MRRSLAALVVVGALSACGTTVPMTGAGGSSTGLSGGTSDGTGVGSTAASEAQSQAQQSPGPVARQAATGQLPGTAVQPRSTVAGPGATATAIPVKGQGWDAHNVYLGIPVQTDVNAGAAALGFTNVDFGDQLGQVKAIIADINAHGGLFGREVVAVIRDVKTADLETDSVTEAQATCTQFTQDRPVIGVVNLLSAIDRPAFYACLAKKHTPITSAGLANVDDAFLARYAPYLYKTSGPSMDQLTPVWLDRLVAEKYFTGWDTNLGQAGAAPVKVGLLYSPDPQPAIFKVIEAGLKARGIQVAASFEFNSQQDMASAVLKFRNAGVTHVISGNGDVYFFMQTAESQHYRPRYAISSYMGTYVALITLGAPAGQLAGALGVGWNPVDDVAAEQDPGAAIAGQQHCHDVMVRGGQSDISKRSVQHQAYNFCDAIYLLVEGAKAGGGLDAASIRRGTALLGSGFRSALTFRSGLSATRPYIPGAVRDLGYDSGCHCFRYLPGPLTVL